MRLFIAVPLDVGAKRQAEKAQDALRRQQVRGSWTAEEDLHVTLAFVGEYPDPDRVLEVLERVSFRPFPVCMDRIGRFGDLWWIGFAPCGKLDALAGKVRRALAEGGIPFDRKRFRAHVTILRRARVPGDSAPYAETEKHWMTVSGFSLLRSDRGKNGMVYTELGHVPAKSPPGEN